MNLSEKSSLLAGPRIWRFNRLRYPGWIIPPRTVRRQVWHATRSWVNPIAAMGDSYTTAAKLFSFRELNWRLETILLPMFSNLAESTARLLTEFEPSSITDVTIDFGDCIPNPTTDLPEERSLYADLPSEAFVYESSDIKESWKQLAFGLLRYSREERLEDQFTNWLKKIAELNWKTKDDDARIEYEKALWGLAHLNATCIEEALASWPAETSLVWKMKRSSILLQIGDIDNASQLVNECYERIQGVARNHHLNLALLSLEAWVVMIIDCIQDGFQFRSIPAYDTILHTNVKRRITQLSRMKYDPWQLLEQFRKIKESVKPGFRSQTRAPGFHPSDNRVTQHLGQDYFGKLKPAYMMLRFTEEAPFPPHFGTQNLCSDAVRSAASWLIDHDPVRTDSVLFHLKDEKLRNKYLSRHRVAAMPEERLNDLYQTAKSGLQKALDAPKQDPVSIEPKARFLQDSIKTALDVIARLVIRMPVHEQVEMFDIAVKLYSNDYLSKSRYACDPLKLLFKSLFGSLPDSFLRENFSRVVELPIPDPSGFPVFNSYSWPYVVVDFSKRIQSLGKVNASDWEKPANKLLEILEKGEPNTQKKGLPRPDARSRALLRLEILFGYGCLNELQKAKLGSFYWNDTLDKGIPKSQVFTYGACLTLPAPGSIDVESRFKKFVLDFDEEKPLKKLMSLVNGWTFANSIARNPVRHRNTIVSWNDDELDSVMSLVELVWKKVELLSTSELSDARRFAFNMGEPTPRQMTFELIDAIRALILYENEKVKLRLRNVIGQIRKSYTIVELMPVFHLIDPSFEIVSEMRSALASHERPVYVACLSALVHWIRHYGATLPPAGIQLPTIPLELIQELGVIVANRRQPDLDQALSASSFYVSKTTELDTSFVHSVLVGLEFLFKELEYSFVESSTSIYEYDSIPELRRNAVELAFSLRQYHHRRDSIVERWLESAAEDPLPEIRHELSKPINSPLPGSLSMGSNAPDLFAKLKPLLKKTASKKDVADLKSLLARIEVDMVETQSPDPRLVALAICHAAKLVLVSKKVSFAKFVESVMSDKAGDRKQLLQIFQVAREDDSEVPKDTLRIIESAFGVDSISRVDELHRDKSSAKPLSESAN